MEWYRASELSCDRAAALVTRDPELVCRTLMSVGSGLPAGELDLSAFIRPDRGLPPGRRHVGLDVAAHDAADRHPPDDRQPHQAAARLGALGRVRPDRRRRVHAPWRGAAAARGGRRRDGPLRRPLQGDVRRRRQTDGEDEQAGRRVAPDGQRLGARARRTRRRRRRGHATAARTRRPMCRGPSSTTTTSSTSSSTTPTARRDDQRESAMLRDWSDQNPMSG